MDKRLLYADTKSPDDQSIDVKLEPKPGGARLNRNSKKIVAFGLILLVVLVFTGVAMSGHRNAGGGDEVNGSSATDMVGTTPPPSPPASQEKKGFFGFGDEASSPKAAENPLRNPGAPNIQNGQASPVTEKQKYRQWLISQHYKDLEGNYLAAQSAKESSFGDPGSGLHPVSSTSGASPAADPVAGYRAMQDSLASQNGDSTSQNANADAGSQDRNRAFLTDQKKRDDGYLQSGVEEALGKHELLAGSIIPAVLITRLDSDLPGVVTAMVRQTVYDSLHPNLVVIPQGAKLIGQYSSDVAFGQSRALIAWNRIIFPNGSMLDLQGMLGTDGQGQSGFADQVDNHYLKIFGSSILISLLGVGAQLSQPQNAGAFNTPSTGQQAAAAMAQSLDNAGTQVLQKNLGIQPTIQIRAGYLFNVMVNRTMILPVYPGQ